MSKEEKEEYTRKESLARKIRREKAKKQLPIGTQTDEQERDTFRKREKRKDLELKFSEQITNTISRNQKREDPNIRIFEQAADTISRSKKREDPTIRAIEQETDTIAKKAKREDPKFRVPEQKADTSARSHSRIDSEIQIRDMLVKKNSRDSAKQSNELLQVENTNLYKSMPSYFEHQSELLCGEHAINNLFQYKLFTTTQIINHAKELQKTNLERVYYSPSPRGNFTTDLLTYALETEGLIVKMANKSKVIYYFNSRDPLMLLISHLKHHYSARRFTQNGDLWIFDSCNKYPYKD